MYINKTFMKTWGWTLGIFIVLFATVWSCMASVSMMWKFGSVDLFNVVRIIFAWITGAIAGNHCYRMARYYAETYNQEMKVLFGEKKTDEN